MNFDTKQKVLLRLYLEYQKDIPEMNSITPDELELEPEPYIQAIRKLENEYLIDGINYSRAGGRFILTFIETAAITLCGIQYIEEKFDIPPALSGLEKVTMLKNLAKSWSWPAAGAMIDRALARIS